MKGLRATQYSICRPYGRGMRRLASRQAVRPSPAVRRLTQTLAIIVVRRTGVRWKLDLVSQRLRTPDQSRLTRATNPPSLWLSSWERRKPVAGMPAERES